MERFFLHVRQLFLCLSFSVVIMITYHILYLRFFNHINYFTVHYFGIRFYILILSSIIFQSKTVDYFDEKIKSMSVTLFTSKSSLLSMTAIWLIGTYLVVVHWFFKKIQLSNHNPTDMSYLDTSYLVNYVTVVFFIYGCAFLFIRLLLPIYVFSSKYIWRNTDVRLFARNKIPADEGVKGGV